MTYQFAETWPEGLLERGGEGLIRSLRGPRRADAADRRARDPRQRMPGDHVRGKLGGQPAGDPAKGERRATKQQSAGPECISGVGRQLGSLSQRFGTSPRAPRSHVHDHDQRHPSTSGTRSVAVNSCLPTDVVRVSRSTP